tara:strand:+ start:1651 stop:2049 length:399 start_codon:yes stop_codon:yes gene_type:complete
MTIPSLPNIENSPVQSTNLITHQDRVETLNEARANTAYKGGRRCLFILKIFGYLLLGLMVIQSGLTIFLFSINELGNIFGDPTQQASIGILVFFGGALLLISFVVIALFAALMLVPVYIGESILDMADLSIK